MAERICSIDGCDRPSRRRGWCTMHYSRWYEHGTTDKPRPRPRTPKPWMNRLAGYFTVGDGCWVWNSSRDVHGYGRFWRDGHGMPAHRVLFELMVGPVPDGLELDHLCRNKACVRPDHLEPVTHQENTRRAYAQRTHCPQGHPYDEQNTYIQPSRGTRVCRICQRTHNRERKRRLRAAARAA